MDLIELATGFLEADGFRVRPRARDLIYGSRNTVAGEQAVYLGVPDVREDQSFTSQEQPFLDRFEAITRQNPAALKLVLVPTLSGLSTTFRRRADDLGFKFRVPAFFFDTPFKWESSPEASSAAKELSELGSEYLRRRAPQPFEAEERQVSAGHTDILPALEAALDPARSGGKSVHIVVGAAGMGKSYLFTCLFASLHKKFLDAKGRQIQTPRPLPLLPQYMPYADATNSVKSLLRAYLQTDMARPLDVRLFEWMLEHGLTTWMLDGLDEVIERDPTFFDYLTDLILDSEPDTPPRVVICIRDSLITTNSAFRDFLEECKEWTAIYHMSPWGTPSKRAFARIALGSRSDEFLSAITASHELDSLASNPYYCEMLSAQFEIGEMRSSYSILELLQVALADIIRRDHRKKPPALDPNVLTEKVVTDFAEAMAATDLEEGFAGVGIDDARELALLSLPAGLTSDAEERLRDQLTKAGLFASGSMGRLRFAQEVLEQFLLGRWLAQVFFRNPPDVLPRLALRQLNPDSISAKVFADEVRAKKGESRLLELLPSATDRPAAFKNVLQVAMLAGAPISDLPAGLLENRDLSAMSFVRSDLSEASLRNSDLSDTTFSGCLMRGVALEGATLRNTRFAEIGEDGMKDADFGSLTRFYSIVVDKNRVLDSVDAVNKWLGLKTAKERVAREPCRAAMQLRLVFGKYVRPNGAARRDWHDEKALLSGARHIDNTKELIRELVQAGYLVEDRRIRGRYRRPEGDEYAQMRGFTTDLALSSSLKLVLDEVCSLKDCPHVPQIAGA